MFLVLFKPIGKNKIKYGEKECSVNLKALAPISQRK